MKMGFITPKDSVYHTKSLLHCLAEMFTQIVIIRLKRLHNLNFKGVKSKILLQYFVHKFLEALGQPLSCARTDADYRANCSRRVQCFHLFSTSGWAPAVGCLLPNLLPGTSAPIIESNLHLGRHVNVEYCNANIIFDEQLHTNHWPWNTLRLRTHVVLPSTATSWLNNPHEWRS